MGTPSPATRFLRLQSPDHLEDAPGADGTEPGRPAATATRPLVVPDTAPVPPLATASQRVRLRLDPEIATQPLPESERPIPPAPAWTPAIPEPPPAATTRLLEQAIRDIPFTPPSAPALPEESAPVIPPISYATIAASSPLPAAPGTSWLQRTKRLTPPPQPGSPRPRGEQPPRPAPDEPPAANATVSGEASTASAATESRPLPRPELRRAAAPPLARMARREGSLGRGFWIVLIIVLLLLVAVLCFFGIVPRVAAFLAQRAQPAAVPAPAAERTVVYAVARRAMTPVELTLTGTIEPFQQTPLYARTSGYVRDWLVDIGDSVRAGQVLAELDTPDVDHQLTQARATADEARAHLTLAQDEAKRWDAMAAAHAVSQQDADEKDSARDEAQAAFNAAQAGVARLVDLELFKEIRAPYAGRIAARNLEVGTLVAAGSGTPGSELFRLVQTDPVRVFVQVPESGAPAIRPGLVARIAVASFPDRIFNGTVVRNAGILDPVTHTLRTELSVANPDGALLPGAQAGVRLQLGDTVPTVLIPADTLVPRRSGLAVARLTGQGGRDVVHFTPVEIGRDFGTEVEVLDTIREGDRLVSRPPSDLEDGTAVNARPLEPSPIPSLLPPKPSAPRA